MYVCVCVLHVVGMGSDRDGLACGAPPAMAWFPWICRVVVVLSVPSNARRTCPSSVMQSGRASSAPRPAPRYKFDLRVAMTLTQR